MTRLRWRDALSATALLLALAGPLPVVAGAAIDVAAADMAEAGSRAGLMLAAYPEVQRLLASGDVKAALKILQAHQSDHENDPRYFTLVGTLALQQRDFASAAVAYERVVLMEPDNAGAWMDLAIASTETGNFADAASYFDHIEAAFTPPPALLRVIAAYRARMVTPATATSGWKVQFETFVGSDSNANSGLQNSSIPLTFGADRIDLVLDGAYHARSDRFAQVAASADYKQQTAFGTVDVTMNARQRSYRQEHDFSTLELNLGSSLRRSSAMGDFGLGLNVSHLSLGSSALLRTLRTGAQWERPLGGCRAGLGLEGEWRRYFSLTTLDADLVWGQAGLACDWHLERIPVQTTLISRTGSDKPTGLRPGGDIRHHELIGQVSAPFAWGLHGELSYTVARANDTDGYSPLLENNAPRRLDRRSIRLTLTHAVGKTGEAIFSVEDNRIGSNLALFQQSGQVIGLGLRKNF